LLGYDFTCWINLVGLLREEYCPILEESVRKMEEFVAGNYQGTDGWNGKITYLAVVNSSAKNVKNSQVSFFKFYKKK
jgi:hypothetical protein